MNTVEFSQQNDSHDEILATEDRSSELLEPRWSVISFEKCEASRLIYNDALGKMRELEKNGIPGLCIVTEEAAAKLEH